MNDNKLIFSVNEYDKKIKQTLPYYDDFYEQVIELVKSFNYKLVKWLDIGCGTGKMGSVAFKNLELEKFVFCDLSNEMIKISREHFNYINAEFCVSDIQNLLYNNEFDVITAIQVNHYFNKEERKMAIKKCYKALRDNGLFISFENFAPFTEIGKSLYLEKWKNYQNMKVERYISDEAGIPPKDKGFIKN